jgi:SAM-dependent methyltransferase
VGYVFSFEDAQAYDGWFHKETGHMALAIEKEAISRLWSPTPGKRLLEVGCGTGIFLQWFAEQGLLVTGLDPSPYMLNLARQRLANRADLERGLAEDLPFSDNAFDVVALITTLEFVDDPLHAIQEACRVAREKVLLGVLNKYSLISWQRRLESLWKTSLYRHARFFSVFELQHLVAEALSGPVPVRWRTCLALPLGGLKFLRSLERSRYIQWQPFGHFIAMAVDIRYTLRLNQQPLFQKIPPSLQPSHPRATCWHLPKKEQQDYRPSVNF